MEQIELTAQPRTGLGKEIAKKLRKDGLIPCVLYGPASKEAIPLAVKALELNKALTTGARGNVLVNLEIEGDKKKARTVMFRDIQRDPLQRSIIHVDLYELLMDHKVMIDVPIHLTGKSQGVEMGGILQHEARTLKIECLPNQIPDKIDVDVTNLAIGHSIHVKDIPLPHGLRVVGDPNITIALITAPTAEAEVKTAEEAKAEIAKSFEIKEEEGKKAETKEAAGKEEKKK
ncbi:MAG: 50S ribosomal protein L25/general stress protein Ctc [Deltaproteobacteria bacterium]|nr:50S ribosomal protein L25/general stress protein Ctc [Deltaproteobacteria bacterium]